MKRVSIFLLLFCFSLYSKSQIVDSIQSIINRDTSLVIKEVFSHPEFYRLRIILTEVSTDSKGKKKLTTWHYRDTSKEYFYPASLVKIPLVLSTMQFINEQTVFSKDFSDTLKDFYSPVRKRTIRDDLCLMLSVSDNYAFNRLYNLVGSKYINISLLKKKYLNTYVIHRFEGGSPDYHQTALPVEVISRTGSRVYNHQADAMYCLIRHSIADSLIGVGYMVGDSLVSKPKSFRYHNYVDIRDVHDMIISLKYPNLTKRRPFNITDEQRALIIKLLQTSPLHPETKEYSDTSIYHQNFLRFNLFGQDKKVSYPNIEYFNKSAMAYGFLSDCNYLNDPENHVEFFLSVGLYVNKDGVFNDDKYEYDSIGLPFMKRLGELIYFSMRRSNSSDKGE